MPYEGQTATGPNGEKAVFRGGRWQMGGSSMPRDPTFDYKEPKAKADLGKTQAEIDAIRQQTIVDNRKTALGESEAARSRRQYPVSKQDMATIDRMRQDGEIGRRAAMELRNAATAVDRFRTGPERARDVKRSLVTEDDSIPEQIGRNIYGFAAGVSDQDIADYQDLDRYRQARVATIQQEQRGVQTESDALRYMKSTFGPDKPGKVNARALAEATYNARLDARKPTFYTKWANRHGSISALDQNGRSADQVWNSNAKAGWQKFLKSDTGRRIYGQGGNSARTGGSNDIIDLDDY